jgi:hypothetical protein
MFSRYREAKCVLACAARRVRGIEEHWWDGHGHGLTPDKSQMLPFRFCMGSTSLPLAKSKSP